MKMENANIDIGDDYVLLTHGHYDHSGSFEKFANEFKQSYKLIVGKDFFNSKY